jgi:predicted transposase YbfD/YdcC
MVVKENQSQLLEDLRICFREEPVLGEVRGVARETNKSHGREEVRDIVTSAALQDYLDWPGAEQVMQIRRTVTTSKTGRTRTEEVYAITSLSPARGGPADLLAVQRGHWGIGNRLHWVRDVTFGEDHCPVYKKDAPQAFAALRNVLLALWRFLGHTNMAEAIDLYSAQPGWALDTLGGPFGNMKWPLHGVGSHNSWSRFVKFLGLTNHILPSIMKPLNKCSKEAS